jgi:hypothetical protein
MSTNDVRTSGWIHWTDLILTTRVWSGRSTLRLSLPANWSGTSQSDGVKPYCTLWVWAVYERNYLTDVTSCTTVEGRRHFGRSYCLTLQDRGIYQGSNQQHAFDLPGLKVQVVVTIKRWLNSTGHYGVTSQRIVNLNNLLIFYLNAALNRHNLISLWLFTPLDLGCFLSFLILYTVRKIPWTRDQPSQGRYLHTEQHKHRINAHTRRCLEWNSNLRPLCSRQRRQFMY